MPQIPEGETFQTADGALTFEEFGELVSRVWAEAYPSIPMYALGEATDDVEYPCITWAGAGKQPVGAKHARVVDEFTGEDGRPRTKKMREYHDVFEVRVAADSPKAANQIIANFERFMEQYAGAFKRQGIREVFMLGELPWSYERKGARVISYRTVRYEVHEQFSTIESLPLVERIELIARALRADAPAIVTTVD